MKKNKTKQFEKPPIYQTDLRINATPYEVAKALMQGGAPRREPDGSTGDVSANKKLKK